MPELAELAAYLIAPIAEAVAGAQRLARGELLLDAAKQLEAAADASRSTAKVLRAYARLAELRERP